MPNAFSYFALFLWPLITFVLFRTLSRPYALIASILGGYLLLPFGVGVDLPMLPTLDKNSIAAVSALLALLLVRQRSLPNRPRPPRASVESDGSRATPSERRNPGAPREEASTAPRDIPWGRTLERILLALLFVSPIVTVLTNADPYAVGPRVLPGLTSYDTVSILLSTIIGAVPYLLARRYLGDPEGQRRLLLGLAVAGLLYSIPTVLEVRISPQLSRWVYGFLAQPFSMSVRDGGYRPIVFLQNGLWLAIFLCVCAVAAFALWRLRVSGRRWLAGGLWLTMTLVLCHSFGALAIAIAILPLLLLVPARGQLVVASLVATVIVLYPMLRTANLIPVEMVASLADSVNTERADSLQYRVNNENILLAHANARPLAGWGIWGRSRVYSEKTGADISVTDGMWIIVIGTSGWLGYVALFGLLAAPAVVLALQRRRAATLAEAGLALALAANLIDLIPNATLTPVTWLIAGGLAGGYAVRRPIPASTRAAANVRRNEPSPQHASSSSTG